MKMRLSLFILLICTQLSYSSDTLEDYSSGLPEHVVKNKAHVDSYVNVETQKLAKAKVVWVNYDLLKQMNIDVPQEGLTKEFEKRLLDRFAYMVPSENDAKGTFSQDKKTFYADRYGGYGAGTNHGSGRAASSGKFQIKGIGRTSLVSSTTPEHHAHGGASFKESIQEAIWGEINHKELPHGSNRVALIIDSGTYTHWEDGGKEARALIVREDPLRPAHYIPTTHSRNGGFKTSDLQRTKDNLSFIENSLPYPKGVDFSKLSKVEKVKLGFTTMISNMAEQFAATHARRILHGGISPSNIEIDGKFLDFGTQTALSGYGNARVLTHGAYFNEEFLVGHKAHTIDQVYNQLYKSYGAQLGSRYDFHEVAETKYKHFQKIEMLEQIGLPYHFAKDLLDKPDVNRLAQNLIDLINSNQEQINVDKLMPKKMGQIEMKNLFKTLSLHSGKNPKLLHGELLDIIKNKDLVDKLFKNFLVSYADISEYAGQVGVSKKGLGEYMMLKSELRNKPMTGLYRDTLSSEQISIVDQYKANNNSENIKNYIDHKIANNSISPQLDKMGQLTLKQSRNPLTGETHRLVYNLEKAKKILLIESPLKEGSFFFSGQKLNKNLLESGAKIRFTSDNWKSFDEVSAKVSKDKVRFELDIKDSFDIEYKLRSHDHVHWYGDHGQNIKFTRPDFMSYCLKAFK